MASTARRIRDHIKNLKATANVLQRMSQAGQVLHGRTPFEMHQRPPRRGGGEEELRSSSG